MNAFVTYRIGSVEIRPAERQVLSADQSVPLGARAFDLLLTLIEHRDRLLSKDELLDRVWPGVVVEENNLQVQVSTLRKLLGPKAIATVPGRGYRFTAAVDDSGSSASPALQALLAATSARAATAAPGTATATAAPAVAAGGNLPTGLPPLLGRDAELAELARLLQQHRLVTLLGAGGIGKTRLAIAGAQQLAWTFADRAWLVELAALSDPADVALQVARTLGIRLPGEAPPEQELAARLQHQQLLLVVDNCEHLVDAVARLLQHLLQAAPGLRVLATSQEPLKLAAEQLLRLGPLAVPDPDTPPEQAQAQGAVALFAARAAAAQGRFDLDASNLGAVIDICRQLDGMALAIELAAGRTPLLGVEGVRRHLSERFKLLTGGARDLPSRHRTLRATLDWSHALLSSDEQTVFRRLGVMVGDFGLELAQAVASDEQISPWQVLDHLGTLIDRSLVVAEPGPVPHYRLLETARAYALEQLQQHGELDAMRLRHAKSMRRVLGANAGAPPAERLTLDRWKAQFAHEVDNLRAAIEWARERDTALTLDLLGIASELMYRLGRYTEGLHWLRDNQALVTAETPPLVRARFQVGLAVVGLHAMSVDERLALLAQARPLLEQERQYVGLLNTLTLSAYVSGAGGRLQQAQDLLDECRPLFDQVPAQVPQRGMWQFVQGLVYLWQGQADEAIRAFEQAQVTARTAGDSQVLGYARTNLAVAHHAAGHLDEAVSRFERLLLDAAHLPGTTDDVLAFASMWLVRALAERGALAEAATRLRQALPLLHRGVGLRHFAGTAANLAARQGRAEAAARLLGADDAAHLRRAEPRPWMERRTLEATCALLAATVDADTLQRWRAEGSALDEEGAIALAVG